MRKEKISIGKVDASREREFLEKYNLLGDNLLGGIEQELKNFMELLPEQSVLSVKVPKKQNGSYTRAYIELDMAADKESRLCYHEA